LITNVNHTMIHLVPGASPLTNAEKGCKQVSLYGLEEKLNLTSFLAAAVEGLVLGTQSIWCSDTELSCPKCLAQTAAKAAGHVFSCNANWHCSNLTTIQ
jgi:hypothetical protein